MANKEIKNPTEAPKVVNRDNKVVNKEEKKQGHLGREESEKEKNEREENEKEENKKKRADSERTRNEK